MFLFKKDTAVLGMTAYKENATEATSFALRLVIQELMMTEMDILIAVIQTAGTAHYAPAELWNLRIVLLEDVFVSQEVRQDGL